MIVTSRRSLGIRDSWGDSIRKHNCLPAEVMQTLQVNFRISGGYGKIIPESRLQANWKKAMDDVEDGVKYAIEQGWVDKDKVAIYGGSHGGYATLMGLIKTPDLYACGVDYVGVSNIFTFFDSFPNIGNPTKKW